MSSAIAVEVAGAGDMPVVVDGDVGVGIADEAAVGLAEPSPTTPLSLRHKMSLEPSPLKSPVPATCQSLSSGNVGVGVADKAAVRLAEPLADQAIVVAPQDVVAAVAVEVAGAGDMPVCCRAGMSALALPTKPPFDWPSHSPTRPLSLRHKMSSSRRR